MIFEEFWEVHRNIVREYGYEGSRSAWYAAVDDTKKRCAESIKKQFGDGWIETHYQRLEKAIMEVKSE